MAERTMTGRSSGKLTMRSATSLICSADASDDPPNFITTVSPVAAAGCAAQHFFETASGTGAAAWHRTTDPLYAVLPRNPGLEEAAAERKESPTGDADGPAAAAAAATKGNRNDAAISSTTHPFRRGSEEGGRGGAAATTASKGRVESETGAGSNQIVYI